APDLELPKKAFVAAVACLLLLCVRFFKHLEEQQVRNLRDVGDGVCDVASHITLQRRLSVFCRSPLSIGNSYAAVPSSVLSSSTIRASSWRPKSCSIRTRPPHKENGGWLNSFVSIISPASTRA